MKTKISNLITLTIEKLKSLSPRELRLVLAAFAIGIVMLCSTIFDAIADLNLAQIKRLQVAENNIKALPYVLERNARLKKRQAQAEAAYKDVEITEGALAYIESLVKNVAGVVDFQIKDKTTVKFSSKYEQQPFQVSFNTVDLEKLVEFLDEIENGKRPLILGNLSLSKTNGLTPSIKVDLIASTIAKIQN